MQVMGSIDKIYNIIDNIQELKEEQEIYEKFQRNYEIKIYKI